MAIRIQNNISSMNAQRNLSTSYANLSKSLERLSSGYRINKAADDAAGLAISQSLRGDIASLGIGSRNVSEANSLLQVAEGALDQIGNMLTRLKELATQASSANSEANLSKIDAEARELVSEIDRIANTTEYAGTKLIDGSYGITTNGKEAALSGGSGFVSASGMGASERYTLTTNAASATGSTLTCTTGSMSETIINAGTPTGNDTKKIEFSNIGLSLTVNSCFTTANGMTGSITAGSSGASSFQVGLENAATSRVSISLGNATDNNLGKTHGSKAISSVDLSTAANAQDAITTIDAAISDVSKLRGDVGAGMNRLSYAAANISTTMENLTAAESVIRDVDMAGEMTMFTKNQILLQAGTAMLAQANMAPQSVLSLLG